MTTLGTHTHTHTHIHKRTALSFVYVFERITNITNRTEYDDGWTGQHV